MHIFENLENFLRDKDYYIDIFKNTIHVYNYETLKSLTDKEIELELKEFNLIIKGENLVVKEMEKHEILVKGKILEVVFN